MTSTNYAALNFTEDEIAQAQGFAAGLAAILAHGDKLVIERRANGFLHVRIDLPAYDFIDMTAPNTWTVEDAIAVFFDELKKHKERSKDHA